jgi:hypothetical protein
MFEKMRSFADENSFAATDIAGFDTRVLEDIKKVNYDTFHALAVVFSNNNVNYLLVLRALLTNRVNTPILFKGVVMFLSRAMTSGTVGTCEWNSLILLFMLFMAYSSKYGVVDMNDFFNNVCPMIFGDDNIFTAKKKDFTPYAVMVELAKFGITVTSDSKDGECSQTLLAQKDVTFLNRRCIPRTFIVDGIEIKVDTAPLEPSSIIKMLSVLMPSEEDSQISDILAGLTQEQVQFGRERYNEVVRIIEGYLPRLGETHLVVYEPRSFDYWVERWYCSKADEQ